MSTLPEGVKLGPVSARVFGVLGNYSAFPWAILSKQCEWENLDPANLKEADLEILVPLLAQSVSRFATPEKGRRLRAELLGPKAPAKPDEARTDSWTVFQPNASLSPMARRIFNVIKRYTPLAWPILEAQCKSLNLDVASFGKADIQRLIPALVTSITRFSTPKKGDEVRAQLNRLAK